MKMLEILFYVLSATVGLAIGSSVRAAEADRPSTPAVGTYQIACAGGGRLTVVCKIIDTRTGRVVDGN